MQALTLGIVSSPDAFSALEADWDVVLAASQHDEPMLSHLWLNGWWRHFSKGRTLRIGVLRDGGRLVGLLPICARTYAYRPGLSFRRLEWMGASEGELDSITSEYLGPIIAKGYEAQAAAALADGLIAGAFGSWHECVLEMMNGESPLVEMIEAAFKAKGMNVERRTTMEAPFVALPADWSAYEAQLGKKRRLVNNAIRDFEALAGPDGYAIGRATDRASFQAGFEILSELHEERWRAEGKSGAFSRPRFTAFHREVGLGLLEQGRLDLFWIELAGRPVAAHYLLKHRQRTLFYQSGRKMDLPGNVRPGIVIMALALREAIARGDREFDLLGGKSQYKMMFTRTLRPLVRLRVARPSLRERVRTTLIAARDLMRRDAASVGADGD